MQRQDKRCKYLKSATSVSVQFDVRKSNGLYTPVIVPIFVSILALCSLHNIMLCIAFIVYLYILKEGCKNDTCNAAK